MSSTESRDHEISSRSELERSRDSVEGTVDRLNEAPRYTDKQTIDSLSGIALRLIGLGNRFDPKSDERRELLRSLSSVNQVISMIERRLKRRA